MLASRRCRSVAKMMTGPVRLRPKPVARLEIVLLGFEDGGFGIYDFFYLYCFYAEFFGFMNLVSGFMNFIC